MTDGELLKVLARIQRHTDAIADLMHQQVLKHPNGEALFSEMADNGIGYRWDCDAIGHPHLLHPDRWNRSGDGYLKYSP